MITVLDYPPCPKVPTPVLTARSGAHVVWRGLGRGAIAGMWTAASVAAIPSAILLFYAGVGIAVAILAVAIGAVVGAAEGLIEGVALVGCRGWIGTSRGRAKTVGAVAVVVLPAGVALWCHDGPVSLCAGVFAAVACAIAAKLAGGLLWRPA